MNVIVANKQKKIIDNANIDAIKDFKGLFNVDDLISKFKNYFFSKLILDATSIINFTSRTVLEKLATSIGADRLVILLPESPLPPKSFVDLLLELKIYNFSNKIEDVVSFLAKPNTYDDIIKTMKYDNLYVDNSIKDSNLNQDSNSTLNNNSFSKNELYEDDRNNEKINQFFDNRAFTNKKIIGFKNVTLHAGTTTLIYLLMESAQQKYKKRALAIEIASDDFKYYRDDKMIKASPDSLKRIIADSNDELFFVDLNNFDGDISYFNDIIYLVEPSIIKLNKLMMDDKFAFKSLIDRKIILNKSFLSSSDVGAFAKEAGVNIFMNISPLNDRVNNDLINKLLNNLM